MMTNGWNGKGIISSIALLSLPAPHSDAQDLQVVDDVRWDDVATDAPSEAARFGRSIASDGRWTIIAASGASSTAGTSRAGRLMLFEASQSGSPWQFVKALEEPADTQNCRLGERLKMVADVLVAVGASAGPGGACRPFVYRRDAGGTGNWGLVGQIGEPGAVTGLRREGAWSDVDIDGTQMAVGRSGTDAVGDTPLNSLGEVAIYQQGPGGAGDWNEVAVIILPEDQWVASANFGSRVALAGDQLLVGAAGYSDSSFTSVGRAWLFERNLGGTNNWGLRETFLNPRPGSSGFFGDDVDIESNMAAIAGPAGDLTPETSNDRAVYVYGRDEGGANNWGLADELLPSVLNSGFGGEIQIDNGLMLVGDGTGVFTSSGAWLYERNGELWSLRQSFLEADTEESQPELFRNLGLSVGLANAGSRIVTVVADDTFELSDGGARVGKAFFFEYDDALFTDSFE